MASGSTRPFCHNKIYGQTDKPTHRPTDRIGGRSVRIVLTLDILIESNTLIIIVQFGHDLG